MTSAAPQTFSFRSWNFEERNGHLNISKSTQAKNGVSGRSFSSQVKDVPCKDLVSLYSEHIKDKIESLTPFSPQFSTPSSQKQFAEWKKIKISRLNSKLKNPLGTLQEKVAQQVPLEISKNNSMKIRLEQTSQLQYIKFSERVVFSRPLGSNSFNDFVKLKSVEYLQVEGHFLLKSGKNKIEEDNTPVIDIDTLRQLVSSRGGLEFNFSSDFYVLMEENRGFQRLDLIPEISCTNPSRVELEPSELFLHFSANDSVSLEEARTKAGTEKISKRNFDKINRGTLAFIPKKSRPVKEIAELCHQLQIFISQPASKKSKQDLLHENKKLLEELVRTAVEKVIFPKLGWLGFENAKFTQNQQIIYAQAEAPCCWSSKPKGLTNS